MPQLSHSEMVLLLSKPGEVIRQSLSAMDCHNLHMALGVAGEAGEVVDLIKKATMYNKPMDRAKLIEEMGDVEFYLEGLRQGFKITREEVLQGNLDKLLTGANARYAEGNYSDQQAQDRADMK